MNKSHDSYATARKSPTRDRPRTGVVLANPGSTAGLPPHLHLMIAQKGESQRRKPVLPSVMGFNNQKPPAFLPNERKSQQSYTPSVTPSKSKPTL